MKINENSVFYGFVFPFGIGKNEFTYIEFYGYVLAAPVKWSILLAIHAAAFMLMILCLPFQVVWRVYVLNQFPKFIEKLEDVDNQLTIDSGLKGSKIGGVPVFPVIGVLAVSAVYYIGSPLALLVLVTVPVMATFIGSSKVGEKIHQRVVAIFAQGARVTIIH